VVRKRKNVKKQGYRGKRFLKRKRNKGGKQILPGTIGSQAEMTLPQEGREGKAEGPKTKGNNDRKEGK